MEKSLIRLSVQLSAGFAARRSPDPLAALPGPPSTRGPRPSAVRLVLRGRPAHAPAAAPAAIVASPMSHQGADLPSLRCTPKRATQVAPFDLQGKVACAIAVTTAAISPTATISLHADSFKQKVGWSAAVALEVRADAATAQIPPIATPPHFARGFVDTCPTTVSLLRPRTAAAELIAAVQAVAVVSSSAARRRKSSTLRMYVFATICECRTRKAKGVELMSSLPARVERLTMLRVR